MKNTKKETQGSKHATLDEVRRQIDALDTQVQALISARARLAWAARESKGQLENAVDYYRPEREAQVLRAVVERNQGPISDAEMLRLFREIMSVCLAQQEPLENCISRPGRHIYTTGCNPAFRSLCKGARGDRY